MNSTKPVVHGVSGIRSFPQVQTLWCNCGNQLKSDQDSVVQKPYFCQNSFCPIHLIFKKNWPNFFPVTVQRRTLSEPFLVINPQISLPSHHSV